MPPDYLPRQPDRSHVAFVLVGALYKLVSIESFAMHVIDSFAGSPHSALFTVVKLMGRLNDKEQHAALLARLSRVLNGAGEHIIMRNDTVARQYKNNHVAACLFPGTPMHDDTGGQTNSSVRRLAAALWGKLHIAHARIMAYEASKGMVFDQVLYSRADMHFHAPIGPQWLYNTSAYWYTAVDPPDAFWIMDRATAAHALNTLKTVEDGWNASRCDPLRGYRPSWWIPCFWSVHEYLTRGLQLHSLPRLNATVELLKGELVASANGHRHRKRQMVPVQSVARFAVPSAFTRALRARRASSRRPSVSPSGACGSVFPRWAYQTEVPNNDLLHDIGAVWKPGYCDVTAISEGRACLATDRKGSWPARSQGECVAMCVRCPRCHFVSWTPDTAHNPARPDAEPDCSWFHACPSLAPRLSFDDRAFRTGHRTLQVRERISGIDSLRADALVAAAAPGVWGTTRICGSTKGRTKKTVQLTKGASVVVPCMTARQLCETLQLEPSEFKELAFRRDLDGALSLASFTDLRSFRPRVLLLFDGCHGDHCVSHSASTHLVSSQDALLVNSSYGDRHSTPDERTHLVVGEHVQFPGNSERARLGSNAAAGVLFAFDVLQRIFESRGYVGSSHNGSIRLTRFTHLTQSTTAEACGSTINSVVPNDTLTAQTRAYLRAVHPSASKSVEELSETRVHTLFASLDYFYRCSDAMQQEVDHAFVPQAAARPCAHGLQSGSDQRTFSLPPLPYLPSGVYFSAMGEPEEEKGLAGANGRTQPLVAGGALWRWSWPQALQRVDAPLRASCAPTSSYGARLGPAPLWTSPFALVKYVLHPNGLPTSGGTQLPPVAFQLHGHPRVKELFLLRDNDLLEVEQWGGWSDVCPEVCGLFANIWRGTGVFLKVRRPLVTLSKMTAVIELLRILEVQSVNALVELASLLGLSINQSGFLGDEFARTLLTEHPCPVAGGAAEHVPLFQKWLTKMRKYAARDQMDALLRLDDHPLALKLLSQRERYVLHWTLGLCGHGPVRARTGVGWDGLIHVLACLTGHSTIVFAAAPNDNGLLHQEVVDFEGAAWPAHNGTVQPSQVRHCLRAARGQAVATRPPLYKPEREHIYDLWKQSHKWQLVTSIDAVRHAGVPCTLGFGRSPVGLGSTDACTFRLPAARIRSIGPSDALACWAWCAGQASQAHASASLLQVRPMRQVSSLPSLTPPSPPPPPAPPEPSSPPPPTREASCLPSSPLLAPVADNGTLSAPLQCS